MCVLRTHYVHRLTTAQDVQRVSRFVQVELQDLLGGGDEEVVRRRRVQVPRAAQDADHLVHRVVTRDPDLRLHREVEPVEPDVEPPVRRQFRFL